MKIQRPVDNLKNGNIKIVKDDINTKIELHNTDEEIRGEIKTERYKKMENERLNEILSSESIYHRGYFFLHQMIYQTA